MLLNASECYSLLHSRVYILFDYAGVPSGNIWSRWDAMRRVRMFFIVTFSCVYIVWLCRRALREHMAPLRCYATRQNVIHCYILMCIYCLIMQACPQGTYGAAEMLCDASECFSLLHSHVYILFDYAGVPSGNTWRRWDAMRRVRMFFIGTFSCVYIVWLCRRALREHMAPLRCYATRQNVFHCYILMCIYCLIMQACPHGTYGPAEMLCDASECFSLLHSHVYILFDYAGVPSGNIWPRWDAMRRVRMFFIVTFSCVYIVWLCRRALMEHMVPLRCYATRQNVFHCYILMCIYCLIMQACPQGTYGPAEMLSDASECTQCDGGYYCPTAGHIWSYYASSCFVSFNVH